MRILFIDILTDDPKQRRKIEKTTYQGKGYSDRCRRAFGLSPKEWRSIDASLGIFPDARDFDAVVVGGSIEDPVDPKSDKLWMKKTFTFLRNVQKNNVPLLGACGGMQFVARALGAEVIFNPRGRRIGTHKVTLTPQGKGDPLFVGLPTAFRIAAAHRCVIKKLLPGWKTLASAELSPLDAIAIGDRIRLLQFHPEMTCRIMRSVIHRRKEDLIKEGIPRPQVCLSDRAGKKILKNFLRLALKTKNSL